MTRTWRPSVIGALLLLLVVLPAAVTFYADWLWFGETGYRDVFVRRLTAQATLGAGAMALACGFLLLNVRIAMRAISPRSLVLTTREGLVTIAIDRHRMQPLGTAVAAALALLFGVFAAAQWREWLFFRHGQPFGEIDPVLGKDIGFFVFRLPFLEAVHGYLFALVAVAGVTCRSAVSAGRRHRHSISGAAGG